MFGFKLYTNITVLLLLTIFAPSNVTYINKIKYKYYIEKIHY